MNEAGAFEVAEWSKAVVECGASESVEEACNIMLGFMAEYPLLPSYYFFPYRWPDTVSEGSFPMDIYYRDTYFPKFRDSKTSLASWVNQVKKHSRIALPKNNSGNPSVEVLGRIKWHKDVCFGLPAEYSRLLALTQSRSIGLRMDSRSLVEVLVKRGLLHTEEYRAAAEWKERNETSWKYQR